MAGQVVKLKDRYSGGHVWLTVRNGVVVGAMGSDPKRYVGLSLDRARRVARYGGTGLKGAPSTGYKNPAAAVGECRRAGKRGEALLVCALNRKPRGAGRNWTSEAARLAKKSGGLSGSRRRRRRSR